MCINDFELIEGKYRCIKCDQVFDEPRLHLTDEELKEAREIGSKILRLMGEEERIRFWMALGNNDPRNNIKEE